MAIDFTLAPEHQEIRDRVRDFVDGTIKPAIEPFGHREEMDESHRRDYITTLIGLRKQAVKAGLWLPHMPKEWGGMGLGHVALAMVQAEAAKTRVGPWVLNCQAPDEGNMHTLLHWATDEQKQKYLKPLCDGVTSSCFAMTEPEVAGSDPTLIQTHADQGRRRVGDQRPQVVHLRRQPRQVRDPDREDRTRRARGLARRQHRLHHRPAHRGLEQRARGRDDARPRRPQRDRHRRTCASTTRRSSAVAATATGSASTGSARPASRTACAGSPRPRRRST